MLVENHLEELFNFPSISKEDKSDSAADLASSDSHCIVEDTQPVDQWNTIVIHLTKRQLNFIEQRDWQNHIKDRTHEDMPTLENFVKFLTDRCHTLRMLQQSKAKTANSKQSQKLKKKNEKKNEKKISLAATAQVCKYCKGNHSVNWCEEFTKLFINERRKEVMKKNLCINCLNPGHLAEACRSLRCKKCNEKHNTLLHPRITNRRQKLKNNQQHQLSLTLLTQSEQTLL